VEGTYPTQSFGSESALRADGVPRYESFLRFEVSGLSGPVIRARVRLYAKDATINGPVVYTTDSEWQESTLTFQSMPAV
jgi:hypothetical protein